MRFVESIFHPSDFTESSAIAFAHALAIALFRQTELTILHAGREYLGEDEWTKFPPVRATLERWGILEPGSPRSAVFGELAVRVKKVNLRRRRPDDAILDYLADKPTDLIVLATEGREGLPGWLRPSLAERVARETTTMTLFVPAGCPGFVALADGEISLRRILVPVARDPNPAAALVYATRVAQLSVEPVEIVALHVGDENSAPELDLPETEKCRFRREVRAGNPVGEIRAASRDLDADLIVMATDGRDGILGAFTGSHTERVLREAVCPVLAVPLELGG